MSDNEENNSNPSEEPVSSSFATPAWPFILLAVLAFVAMRYFESHGGGFSNNVFAKNLRQDPLIIGMTEEQQIVARGKRVYNANCVACHQSHGRGNPGQFPPLAGSDWVNGVGPNRMIRIVLNGLQGPITVNGEDLNAAMAPLGALSDQQIADVLSFVRNNWGNEGSFVTPDQVTAIRGEGKTGPYSPAELLENYPHGGIEE